MYGALAQAFACSLAFTQHLLFIMPLVARLDWVLHQLRMGRRGHISIGSARDGNKYKIKISLEPADAGVIDPAVLFAVTKILGTVRDMVQHGVATDRGHKHSSGHSEICIWVSLAQPVDHEESAQGLNPDAIPFVFTPQGHAELHSTADTIASDAHHMRLVGEWKALPEHAWKRIYHRFKAGQNEGPADHDTESKHNEQSTSASEGALDNVLANLSDEDLIQMTVPRIVERCDFFLPAIQNYFNQGACSIDDVRNAGIEDKILTRLLDDFPQFQDRQDVVDRLREAAREHIEVIVEGWYVQHYQQTKKTKSYGPSF